MIKIILSILFLSFSQISCSADASGGVTHLSQEETLSKISTQDNVVLIDVRTTGEYNNGHIPNAVNIPHKELLNNISLLDKYKDKDLVLYCHSGVRVGKVTDVLSKLRGDVYHIKGDYRAWRANGQTLDRP